VPIARFAWQIWVVRAGLSDRDFTHLNPALADTPDRTEVGGQARIRVTTVKRTFWGKSGATNRADWSARPALPHAHPPT
jgi:hypothetical protein